MPRFTAQVWVSGDHPYDAEINAQNVFQARKNIARREGVDENDVQRVFLIQEDDDHSNSSSGGGIDIGSWGGIAVAAVVLFLLIEFTPWILMFGMGATGAWFGEKITGQSIEEYAESDDDKGHGAISVVLILSLILGGIGFVKGNEIKQSINNDTTTEVQE
jgi:hypothetical protein|tara:strand:+ start:562 stop:1044 length:483 start_codon:yes stop_codon:yes gene_type:complete